MCHIELSEELFEFLIWICYFSFLQRNAHHISRQRSIFFSNFLIISRRDRLKRIIVRSELLIIITLKNNEFTMWENTSSFESSNESCFEWNMWFRFDRLCLFRNLTSIFILIWKDTVVAETHITVLLTESFRVADRFTLMFLQLSMISVLTLIVMFSRFIMFIFMKILIDKLFTMRISLKNLVIVTFSLMISKKLKFNTIVSVEETIAFSMSLTLSDVVFLILNAYSDIIENTKNRSVMNVSQSVFIQNSLIVVLISILTLIVRKCHVLMLMFKQNSIEKTEFENTISDILFSIEDFVRQILRCLWRAFLKRKLRLHFLQSYDKLSLINEFTKKFCEISFSSLYAIFSFWMKFSW